MLPRKERTPARGEAEHVVVLSSMPKERMRTIPLSLIFQRRGMGCCWAGVWADAAGLLVGCSAR
jgi:hypothetical protein